MRILWITSHLPYPPISGGRLREYELIRRLVVRDDVRVIALTKTEDDWNHVDGLRRLCPVEIFPVQPNSDAPCHAMAAHAAPDMSAAVARAVPDVDVVHVEGFYLVQHLPESAVPLFLVDQNIEFQLWEQRCVVARAESEEDRRRLAREAIACRAAEVDAWRRATLCATVTHEDGNVLKTIAPDVSTLGVPDGADHLDLSCASETVDRRSAEKRRAPRLIFVANFAYQPNVDAAVFLLDEILPRVRSQVPYSMLDLVGNAPPASLMEQAGRLGGIRVTGRVRDVTPFLLGADVAVCPLRIGGGVKVKVLEAVVAGIPVVTTPVGAQGLPTGLGVPLVAAPDPDAIAEAVVRALRDPTLRWRSRAAAKAMARLLPTWDEAALMLRTGHELARNGGMAVSA